MAKETYNHSYKELVNLISEDLGYKKEDKFNTFIVKQLQKIRNEYLYIFPFTLPIISY